VSTVPFAREAYERVRASTPETTLLNWIVEEDDSGSVPGDPRAREPQRMLLQRPGLSAFATLPGPVQALYAPRNTAFADCYAVAGNKLYSVTSGGSRKLGDLVGSTGRVSIAANFDRLAIVSYPHFYLYGASKAGTSSTFRQVTIPNFEGPTPKAVAVVMLNSYFVVACEDGTIFWLVPGEDEVDGLHFANAEASPDGLVGVATLSGNLFFFGNTTTEVWQPTGNADLPFQPTTGQNYSRGAVHRDTIVNIDNSVIWVGEDGKVYRAGDTPGRISTNGIDERLKLRSGAPGAWTFSHDGHLFYVLTIPGQGTFAYDLQTKTWSEFGSQGYDYWRPRVGCQTSAGWLCGDSVTGAIWRISDNATDAGTPIIRRASATVALKGGPKRVDNLVLDVGCSAPCEWRVRWADADEQLSAQEWISVPASRAGDDSLSLYRIGAARSPRRTFEVEITDPCVVRLSQARIGEAWR
jgi:hypothetical protein